MMVLCYWALVGMDIAPVLEGKEEEWVAIAKIEMKLQGRGFEEIEVKLS